ncbi:unnamed protein product [Alternaria alternata]|jgi:quercetin dioxygenase-like cupin family protein|uniref:Cupin type-2 domain-containing protein n=1 Tax=Alternaria alternata TaxID=5599 RepID=A0A4Q4NTZ0_ALTAL|nr:hypothetical protein AA0117_g1683 [Alternaria alternata]
MDERVPVIMHAEKVSDLASDSFPDATFGNVVWKTLLCNTNAASDNMCAGIATCPPNGTLALHQHTQAEMYYVLSGSGQVEIDGIRHHVNEGTVLWIPGDAVHGVFCGSDETLKWLYVFPEGKFEKIVYRFKVA